MKKIILYIIITVSFTSCGSYNSIDSFYEAHKNDNNVTAIQVPRFMLSTVGNLIPEMNEFVGNIKDLRYIQLNPKNDSESRLINSQINNLTTANFKELYRKNEDENRTLVSLRERRDVVKEIMIYSNKNNKNSILYLNGDFNPAKVREYANDKKFDNLLNNFTNQYNVDSPATN